MLTRPTCSKHITSANLRSWGATATAYASPTFHNPDTHLYLGYRPGVHIGNTRPCVILPSKDSLLLKTLQDFLFSKDDPLRGKPNQMVRQRRMWNSLTTMQQIHINERQQCCLAIEETWVLKQEGLQFGNMAQKAGLKSHLQITTRDKKKDEKSNCCSEWKLQGWNFKMKEGHQNLWVQCKTRLY